MKIIGNICEHDNELRKIFLQELIEADEEAPGSIDEEILDKVDSGEKFDGINIWERAYKRYRQTLEEEREKIMELNKAAHQRTLKWKDLVGFFGFLLGYHEYVVHPVRVDNLFKSGNSGFFFRSQVRMFAGIEKKKNSPYFRGAAAFDNFCIAYYVAKNCDSKVESHFQSFKEEKLDFSEDDIDKAIESARKIKELLSENPENSFIENIDTIYRNAKVIAEKNPYKKPILPTVAEVDSSKRVKRFQCRIAEGPLTPPRPNVELYNEGIVEWHKGI